MISQKCEAINVDILKACRYRNIKKRSDYILGNSYFHKADKAHKEIHVNFLAAFDEQGDEKLYFVILAYFSSLNKKREFLKKYPKTCSSDARDYPTTLSPDERDLYLWKEEVTDFETFLNRKDELIKKIKEYAKRISQINNKFSKSEKKAQFQKE